MYNNKLLVLFVFVIAFSACQPLEAAATEDVRISQAVADGIIISPDVLRGAQMAFSTVEVTYGRLRREMNTNVSLHFPRTADLSFERGGGRLTYRGASVLQFVEAGEVLMSVTFDEDALRVEEQQLLLRMSEAQRRHDSERVRRRADIEALRFNLHSDKNEFDLEIHALRLESMEAEYQHIITQFQAQRRDQNRQLEEIREKLQGEDLVAPFDGVVSWVEAVRIGTLVGEYQPMVTIYDHYGFQLRARTSADVMRYGDTLMVTDRNGIPRPARVVSDPLVDSSDRGHQLDFILEAIDPEADADYFFEQGLNAQPVALDIYGLLIPTRAIHTEDQRRYVYIYEDGVIRKRYVQVGFFYMGTSQILDGLEAGQFVVLH